MINLTVTTKISAAFLATVLVAGIIALSSPSFMVGAQAATEYGMDNYEKSYGKDNSYKSKDNSVSVKKIKCNNINVNVNGLELDVFPPFLGGGLAAEAQEGSSDASSFAGNGGGGNGGSEISDFRFICINNNNNTVIGDDGGVTPPPVPPLDECEDCFNGVTLTFPITVDLPNLDIVIDDFEELCELIFSPPFSESAEQLLRLVEEIVPAGTPQTEIDAIVCDCLVPLLGIQGACPPGPPM